MPDNLNSSLYESSLTTEQRSYVNLLVDEKIAQHNLQLQSQINALTQTLTNMIGDLATQQVKTETLAQKIDFEFQNAKAFSITRARLNELFKELNINP